MTWSRLLHRLFKKSSLEQVKKSLQDGPVHYTGRRRRFASSLSKSSQQLRAVVKNSSTDTSKIVTARGKKAADHVSRKEHRRGLVATPVPPAAHQAHRPLDAAHLSAPPAGRKTRLALSGTTGGHASSAPSAFSPTAHCGRGQPRTGDRAIFKSYERVTLSRSPSAGVRSRPRLCAVWRRDGTAWWGTEA